MVWRGGIAENAPNSRIEVRAAGRIAVERYRRRARRGSGSVRGSNGYESTIADIVGHCRRSHLCWRLSAAAFALVTNTHQKVTRSRVDLG